MNRWRLAWHVLRGHPLAYRVNFLEEVPILPDAHTELRQDDLILHECLLLYRKGRTKTLFLPYGSGIQPQEYGD